MLSSYIESLSRLVEKSVTKAELRNTLNDLGIAMENAEIWQDETKKIFLYGKEKTTRLCLGGMRNEDIIISAKKAIDRFQSIELSDEQWREVNDIIHINKSENLNLYFGSSEKLDLFIEDTKRGVVSEVDLKGFEKVICTTHDIVTWDFLWSQLNTKYASLLELIEKLRKSIPNNSPQGKRFFDSYIDQTVNSGRLDAPALMPEFYLHYDPMTKFARGGKKAIESQRADFYMQIKNREIILEVDGIQHYAANGKPDLAGYGQQCAWDRDRLLNGYEIYRFGTGEFVDDFEDELKIFMSRLLLKSEISI